MFKSIDTDNSGYIDEKELSVAAEKLGFPYRHRGLEPASSRRTAAEKDRPSNPATWQVQGRGAGEGDLRRDRQGRQRSDHRERVHRMVRATASRSGDLCVATHTHAARPWPLPCSTVGSSSGGCAWLTQCPEARCVACPLPTDRLALCARQVEQVEPRRLLEATPPAAHSHRRERVRAARLPNPRLFAAPPPKDRRSSPATCQC